VSQIRFSSATGVCRVSESHLVFTTGVRRVSESHSSPTTGMCRVSESHLSPTTGVCRMSEIHLCDEVYPTVWYRSIFSHPTRLQIATEKVAGATATLRSYPHLRGLLPEAPVVRRRAQVCVCRESEILMYSVA